MLYEYWQEKPPLHEIAAAYFGIGKKMTTEEKWKNGAMNPMEFARYAKKTGGRIDGK